MRIRRRIRVATANIMGNPLMSLTKAAADMQTTMRAASIVGWQELSHPEYKRTLNRFGKPWVHYHLDVDAPISVNTKVWRVVTQGYYVLFPAEEGRNTKRYLTWVVVEHRKTGRVFTFNNAHYIRAWSEGLDEPKQRRVDWLSANLAHREITQEWVDDKDDIIGVGDFNRHSFPVMGHEYSDFEVDYHVGTGIDYVWSVVRRYLKFVRREAISLNSDHDARVVTFKI